MLRQIGKLHREFFSGLAREIKIGVKENRKGLLVSLAIVFLVLAALTMIVLKVTARPEFCGSCHNMESYIDSWRLSTHRNVPCTDCHFEPGLAGALVGKWKAQAHIVMKITGTAPSRPHTQINDESCLREGCHSKDTLAKDKTVFKGVNFQHATHLGDLRRGKKLRCVTCHSQIVQGEHLTITESACFTCHFFGGDKTSKLADCKLCHTQTREKLYIDANENMPFVHKDYVDRGVACRQCHFDIISGDGHLKDNICVQCHSEPDIVVTASNAEEMHRNHITEHKVECYRCHNVIDHKIVRVETPDLKVTPGTGTSLSISGLVGNPYDTNCAKCHSFDQHRSIRLMYMGAGAAEVADMPSPMYAAHADCGSCHTAIVQTPAGPQTVVRMAFDEVIKSCSDCHGEGYDVMAKHWKKVVTAELDKANAAVASARQRTKGAAADALLDVAEKNLAFVKNGRGVHNMDYALKVLADSQERAEKALKAVNPGYAMRKIVSPNGCAQLCHSCVECIETKPVPFGNVQFPHDVHVDDEGLKCLDCHTPREQHGQTLLKNCNECHHGSGTGSVSCQDCHQENFNLYNGQNACDEKSCDVRGAKNDMVDAVKCAECHVQAAKDKATTRDGIKATCVECHDDDPAYGKMVDDWVKEAESLKIAEATELLKSTQAMVLKTIRAGQYTYDAQDLLNKAEKNLELVTRGNPVHNLAFSKDLLKRVNDLVLQAKKNLELHSTIKTIEEPQAKK